MRNLNVRQNENRNLNERNLSVHLVHFQQV